MAFDLEKAIATWRQFHLHRRVFLREDLDELERHVRDHTLHLVSKGTDEETAFRTALSSVGDLEGGADEYGKVYWGKLRRRRQLADELSWRLSMLANYLRIAFRHMRKQKLYAFINIFGLAVGIACCLLIGLYVRHEWSYDRFHEHADRIYRIKIGIQRGEDLPEVAPHEYLIWSNAAMAPRLAADFPEIEQAIRLSGHHEILLRRGAESFSETRYFYADSSFFEVFSFDLLEGDRKSALKRPNSIVLTQSAARRYFGDEPALGRPLHLTSSEVEADVTVTGIMRDVPANSHMEFDVLLSMSTFESAMRAAGHAYKFDHWGYADFFTYVMLREGTNPRSVETRFPAFLERHLAEQMEDSPTSIHLALEPIVEAYHSQAGATGPIQPGPKGNPDNLYIFSLIGLGILIIACVNFMNLATARSATRAKEVGVRKTVGAGRSGLIGQFLTEAMLLSTLATVLAVGMALVALPYFRLLAGKEIPAAPLLQPLALAIIASGALAVGLLAGSYPALVLSSFRPFHVLKGAFAASGRGISLRKALVVSQFAAAIVLIIGTIVVRQQLQFLQERPLGFDEEQQLLLEYGGDAFVRENLEAVKQELEALPGIRSAAATRSVPGGYFPDAGGAFEAPEGMRDASFGMFEVDFDFLPQIGVVPAAGRLFSRDHPTDAAEGMLINETAARSLGYSDPADAVGKRFAVWGREGEIIGVVRDFHFESLRHEIRPLMFRVSNWLNVIVLSVSTQDVRDAVEVVRERWQTLVPHRPFIYSFLDQSFDALYRTETRFATLFGLFAGLAIFVACLGLFGLASFVTEQRTKEIGVRKVIGATVSGIVVLLTRDFVRMVLVAALIAFPLAYVLSSSWLEDFAFRIGISWDAFVVAAFVAIGVALLTVSYQAVRAALTDPVKSLRYE